MFLWRAEKGNLLVPVLLIGFPLAVFDSFGASVCYLKAGKKNTQKCPCVGFLGGEHFCVPFFSMVQEENPPLNCF